MPETLQDTLVVARTLRPRAEREIAALATDAARWPDGEPTLGLLLDTEQEARDLRGILINLRREEQAHRAAGWDTWVLDDVLTQATEAVERLCSSVEQKGRVVVGPGEDPDPRPLTVETPAGMDAREAWESKAVAHQAELDRRSRRSWRVMYAVMLLAFIAGCWGVLRFASSDDGTSLAFGWQPGLALVLVDLLALAFVATEKSKSSAGWAVFREMWMGAAGGHAAYRLATPEHLKSRRLEGAATSAGAYLGYQQAQRLNERRRAAGQHPPSEKTLRVEWERQRAFRLQAERDRAAGVRTPPDEDDLS
jgi:hypothetical protein